MKLTIKSPAGTKEVIDLNKDLLFNTSKGEQYIFSKGFTNYVLNFKDNQKSVELTFNIEGKSVKVELKGIVPFLQENIPDSENPTSIIINKNISDKDIDLLINNEEFNGSEIIDRLEAIISKPVELGNDVGSSGDLALISDFQTLIESLDAAAAGPGAGAGQGNATGNGSTFNSIFSSLNDSLNGISDTNVWENLSESISTIPVESGPTLAVAAAVATPINVNVNLIGINTNVTEGENASYRVTLTDDAGNSIIATQDTVVTFTYTYITASGTDISETISVTIPTGYSEAPVVVSTIDDALAEGTENFTIEINTVSNQTQFDSVTIDRTPVETTITDDKTPGTEVDPDTASIVLVAVASVTTTIADITDPITGKLILNNANTTPEGGKLFYIAVAIDEDGKPLADQSGTVTVSTGATVDANDNDAEAIDYVAPTTATIGTVFSVDAKDDYIAEGPETLEVTISAPLNTPYETPVISSTASTVTSTITDDKTPGTEVDPDTASIVLVAVASVTTTIADITDPITGKLILNNANTTPEGGKLFYIAVAIDEDGKPLADQSGTVTVSTGATVDANDNDAEAIDYVAPTTATIGTVFSVDAKDDYIAEGPETLEVTISAPLNTPYETPVISSTASTVTSTITDDKTPGTEVDPDTASIVLVAVASVTTTIADITDPITGKLILNNANTTPEGGKLFYIAVAIDEDGKPLADQSGTVTVSTGATVDANDNDAEAIDYVAPTTATIGTVFSVDAKDDYIAEGPETLEVTISAPLNTPYETPVISSTASTVTSTITDDKTPGTEVDPDTASIVLVAVASVTTTIADITDPITGKLILNNANTTPEGGKLFYIAVAIDEDGKPLADQSGTVTVSTGATVDANDNDAEAIDYVAPTTATIGTVFSVDAKDDYIAEGPETLEVTISAPLNTPYETPVISSTASTVTSTITDDKTPGTEVDPDTASIVLVAVASVTTTIADITDPITGKLILNNANTTPEGGKLFYIAVAIDEDGKPLADQSGTVTVSTGATVDANDNDAEAIDYVAPTTATIGTVFSVDAKDDYIAEGPETLEVTISAPLNTPYETPVISSTASTVTSTITDDKTPGTEVDPDTASIVLVAVASVTTTIADITDPITGKLILNNANTTPEGGKLFYIAVAIDEDGKPLADQSGTVTVSTGATVDANDNDAEAIDYVAPTTATIGTVFSVDAKDDYIAEGPETLEVTISAPLNTPYETPVISSTASTVTSTITDDKTPGTEVDPDTASIVLVAVASVTTTIADITDPITGKLILNNANTTPEGGKLFYIAVAIDEDGKPLADQSGTVTVSTGATVDANDNDAEAIDYVAPTTATIGTVFSVDAKDDYIAEGPETLEVTISAPLNTPYETPVISSTASTVTSTITDDKTPGTEVDPDTASIVLVAVASVTTTIADITDPITGKLILNNANTTPEGGKLFYIAVAIDEDGKPLADQSGTVTVSTGATVDANDNDAEAIDYVAPTTATIGTVFSVDAKDDYIAEGPETLEVTISAPLNTPYETPVISSTASTVTSTITDDKTPGTEVDPDTASIVLVAVASVTTTIADITDPITGKLILNNANTTPEGGKLFYIAVAIDEDGKPLADQSGTVTVSTGATVDANDNDAEAIDYVAPTTATIGTVFSVDAKDDYIAEGPETLEVTISAPLNTPYETPVISSTASTVTSTITDDKTPGTEVDPDTASIVLVAVASVTTTIADITDPITGKLILNNANTTPEGGKLFYIAVAIDEDGKPLADQSGTVTVSTGATVDANDNDAEAIDYVAPTTATIGTVFSVDAKDDYIAEGPETLEVTISAPLNTPYETPVISSTASTVTSTITDDKTPGTEVDPDTASIVLVAVASVTTTIADITDPITGKLILNNANTTPEGGKLFYIAVAIDEDGKPLADQSGTVTVSTGATVDANDNDAEAIDYVAPTTATIGTVFSVDAKDDYIAEGPETLEVTISAPLNTPYETPVISSTASTVTSTITDDKTPGTEVDPDTASIVLVAVASVTTTIADITDPITGKLILNNANTTPEGGKLFYIAVAIDEDGKPLADQSGTVTVSTGATVDANDNDAEAIDYVAPTTATIGTVFSVDAKDDYIAEGPETLEVTISAPLNTPYETPVISSTASTVTSTITDDKTPGTEVDPDTASIVLVAVASVTTTIADITDPITGKLILNNANTTPEGGKLFYIAVAIDEDGKPLADQSGTVTVSTGATVDANDNDAEAIDYVAPTTATIGTVFSVDAKDDYIAEGPETLEVTISAPLNTPYETPVISSTASTVTSTITDDKTPGTEVDPDTASIVLVAVASVTTTIADITDPITGKLILNNANTTPEGGKLFYIAVAIDEDGKPLADQSGTVTVSTGATVDANDNDAEAIDYVAPTTATIGTVFSVDAKDDYIAEGPETLEVTISAPLNTPYETPVISSTASTVTSTITDDKTPGTEVDPDTASIVLVAVASVTTTIADITDPITGKLILNNANTTPEGGKLFYIAVAIDEDGKPLADQSGTVTVSTGATVDANDNDAEAIDYVAPTTATIGTVFSVDAKDDYIAEGPETLEVTISAPLNTPYETPVISSTASTVTSTITDDKTPGTEVDPDTASIVLVAVASVTTTIADITDPITGKLILNNANTTPEGGKLFYIAVAIDEDGKPLADQSGTVTVSTGATVDANDNDAEAIDYVAPTTATIGTVFSVDAKDDYIAEGPETLEVTISAPLNTPYETPVISSTASTVTSTITDDKTPGTEVDPDTASIVLVAVASVTTTIADITDPITGKLILNNANTTPEGGKLFYIAVAIDEDGKPLADQSGTVTVSTGATVDANDNDAEAIDYVAPTTATIGTVFSVDAKDDYIAEGPETLEVTISAPLNTPYETPVISSTASTVTSTITDDKTPGTEVDPDTASIVLVAVASVTTTIADITDPITGKLILNNANTTPEGGKLFYIAVAIDEDGKPLADQSGTVTVSTGATVDANDNDAEAIDYVAPTTATIGTVFSVDAKDDYIAEGPETLEVTISAPLNTPYETPVISSTASTVTSTITDDKTPGTEVDPDTASIVLVAVASVTTTIADITDPITGKLILNNANTTPEGGKLFYIAVAIDEDGKPLADQSGTVTVSTGATVDANDNDAEAIDYVAPTTATIGTVFSVDAKDDYIAEGPETLEVTISAPLNTPYETPVISSTASTVTSTITDDKTPGTEVDPDTASIVLVAVASVTTTIADITDPITGKLILNNANTTPEGGKLFYIAVAIDEDGKPLADQSGTVTVSTGATVDANDNDAEAIDYVAPTTATIGTVFSVDAKDDYIAEGPETLEVTISAPLNTPYETPVISSTASTVTSTITDDKTPGTEVDPDTASIVLVAVASVTTTIADITDPITGKLILNNANTTPEGGKLFYIAVAIDEDGKPLADQSGTVTVSTGATVDANDNDAEAIDYVAPTTATIGTVFSVDAKDDYIAEGPETLEVTISAPLNTPYETPVISSTASTVTSTITDDKTPGTEVDPDTASIVLVAVASVTTTIADITDPITGKLILNNANTTPEGGKLFYIAVAIDEDGKPLADQSGTVTVSTGATVDANDNDAEAIDYVAPTTATIGTVFSVDAKDDYIAEGPETLEVTISAPLNTPYETPVISSTASTVTSTITDDKTPGTEVDPDTASIVLVAVASVTTTIADITDPITGKLILNNANTTPEGGKLFYIAVAIDEDGKPLADQSGTVTVSTGATVDANDNDAEAIDYVAPTTATIGTVFSVDAKDDYIAEGPETLEVTISAPLNTPYETPVISSTASTVTSTITDDKTPIVNSVDANDDYGYSATAQGEFIVESFKNGNYQSDPDVTSLKDGGYVIVWSEISGSLYNGAVVNDLNNDGDITDSGETVFAIKQNYDVFMQKYDSNGETVGTATRVNTFVENVNEDGGRSQHDVNVVALENGNILVTWTSDDQYIQEDDHDNGSRYIQGKIYDENGNAICSEFTISRAEYDPIVALPDGGFIVTWSADSRFENTDIFTGNNPIISDAQDGDGYGVIAQRFDAYGNEVGGRLIVNQTTNHDQIDSDITMINNNTAIMTWQSQNALNGDFDIHAQVLNLTANGLALVSNSDIVVASGNADQTNPEITALKDGSAVITYGSDTAIMMKTISSTGVVGGEIVISVSGSNAVITSLSSGFVIAYENNGAIYTKTFDGTTLSNAVQVSSDSSNQTLSSISSLEDGGYIVVWQDDNGISAHRYTANGSEFVQNNYTLNEDTAITITVVDLMSNDTDPQGDSFKITSVSNPSNGIVALNDTNNDGIYDSITFTPNKDYNGEATFDYTITDAKGAVDTARVYLDVKPVGEPSVVVGALCSADVKGINVAVSEGEEAILAVKVSGADANTTLSLSLSDGTTISSDYGSTLYYSFVNENTDMNNITWVEYTNNVSVPENASTMIVKTNTILDTEVENDEVYNLTARLSTGETATGTINIVEYEDVDLSALISANTDVISFENSTNDKITVELNDLIADDDKQLIIRGDIGDIVQLDTPSDWSNAGKEQVDGISYNVFTGTGTNSTIKLLIDDDIDVTPDI